MELVELVHSMVSDLPAQLSLIIVGSAQHLGAQAHLYLLGSAFRGPGLLVFVTRADPPAFYGLGQLQLKNNSLWHFNKKMMVQVATSI